MTDTAIATPGPAARVHHSMTGLAQARIRRRYRAETRFRLYGIAAIVATGLFLAALVVQVTRTGLPAFFQHALVAEVTVTPDSLGAAGTPDASAIRGADYFPITRDALKALIPGIEGRAAERRLTQLLSVGAADDLRARLLADPSLIGKPQSVRLLLSDDADIYLKGGMTGILRRTATGTATPQGTTGTVTILTSANDFAVNLGVIKAALAERAAALRNEAARLARTGEAGLEQRVSQLRTEAEDLTRMSEQPGGEQGLDSRMPSLLVAVNGGLVKATKVGNSGIEGEVLLPLSSTDEAKPGQWQILTYTVPEGARKLSDLEVAFLERFRELGRVESGFNWRFFTSGDSREPELAGIRGALVGSALTLLVTLLLCLPIGVLAAIYLEEFAPKNRLTYVIEVNINNLAAVPSIVFGLLGLAVFLNFFDLPRSAALVGGLVLALLVLPTIIIAARAAVKAVPPSIREAALGVGASHQQAVFHHVLPLAMPGIMTGTIIGMAHALGETAPLLMIGMVAFIVDVPKSFTDAATVLPVQIFLWSDLPEQAFQAKTGAAIIVLLVFLFVMNGLAIWLRKRFERRW